MPAVLQIRVGKELFLKDPEETTLGRRIVSEGLKLIDDIGFDRFTFKKLAEHINSTEASIYRYFSSKQQLLSYLASWYWNWLEYLIEYRTTNIEDARRKLEIAVEVLIESDIYDPTISHIDEHILHRIIVTEGARVYMTKQSRGDMGVAVFEGYNRLVDLLGRMLKQVNSRYKYPNELAMTLVATVHKQIFYFEHAPGKSRSKRKKHDRSDILKFLKHLIFTSLD